MTDIAALYGCNREIQVRHLQRKYLARDVAEDIVQDAWLAMWEQRRKLPRAFGGGLAMRFLWRALYEMRRQASVQARLKEGFALAGCTMAGARCPWCGDPVRRANAKLCNAHHLREKRGATKAQMERPIKEAA